MIRWAAAFLLAALLLPSFAGEAQAQVGRTRLSESPRNWAFEFKMGPYRPGVDRENALGGNTPYRDLFGGGDELMFMFELDWEFFHFEWGTFALGASIGFADAEGKGIRANVDLETLAEGEDRPGDETIFNWMPTALSLIYRFDYLARYMNIPFVPFGKAGLAYYWWWVTDGVGDVSDATDSEISGGGKADGYGGVLGTHLSVGLQFHLDWIDPSSAQHLDIEFGVNDSYIFFEFLWARINRFNTGGFDLSDETWLLGLMFEF